MERDKLCGPFTISPSPRLLLSEGLHSHKQSDAKADRWVKDLGYSRWVARGWRSSVEKR